MVLGDATNESGQDLPAAASPGERLDRGTFEIPLDALGREVLIHKGLNHTFSVDWSVWALLAICLVLSILFLNPGWILLPAFFALRAFGLKMLAPLQAFAAVRARRQDLASGTCLRTTGVGAIRAIKKVDRIDYHLSVGSDEYSTSWVDLEVEHPGALGRRLLNSTQQGMEASKALVLSPTMSQPVRIAQGDIAAEYSRHSKILFRIADSQGNDLYRYPIPEPSLEAAEADSPPPALRSFYRRAPSVATEVGSPSDRGADESH